MSWWTSYFGELYLRLFAAMATPDGTTQEVAAVLALLEPAPGARILDLACGQGRHAVVLARLGYRMSGLDRSAALLELAQGAAQEVGVRVAWVVGDMRCPPFGPQFDVCLSMFTSFGYFEDEAENEQVLHGIAGVLRPGGRLFLDTKNRDNHAQQRSATSSRRHGTATILEETCFDTTTCRSATTFTWLEGGQAESISHSVRLYTAAEMTAMMRRAGLEPVALYGNMDGSPLAAGSKRLIVVARKGGGDDGRR